MHRTKQDWRAILQQQKDSGLSISAFCQKHKLSTSSFYKHKQINVERHDFVEAKVVPTEGLTRPVSSFTLDTPAGRLSLPASTPSSFLVQLIRGLL